MSRLASSPRGPSGAESQLLRAQLAPLIAFRAGLVTLCALLSAASAVRPAASGALLSLAVGTGITYRLPRLVGPWSVLSGFVVAAAIPLTGAGLSPLLPYLLATGLTCGLLHSGRRLVTEVGLLAGVLLAGGLWSEVTDVEAYLLACAEWVVLALTVGALTRWARALETGDDDEYDAVRGLLQQLRSRARDLPGGLDATDAAEAVLLRCAVVVDHQRSALLVRTASAAFVPLAVRGASRVPWRGPEQGGALRAAWETGRPALDRRPGDVAGPRAGSALLAVPLLSGGERLGLLILESLDPQGFSADEVEAALEVAEEGAPRLEAALLFEEVRDSASHHERGRLAREMHDGIAQELVCIGYELDDLRVRAAAVDADLGERVVLMRQGVTSLVSNLRLSITDLRTTLRTDRGLGEALGTYLRAVCSGRDVQLNLSLQESEFRLPGDVEVALLRVVQGFAQEARHRTDLKSLSADLTVDAPSAALRLEAECGPLVMYFDEVFGVLTRAGAHVGRCGPQDANPWVEVVLEGDTHDVKPRRDGNPGAANRFADDGDAGGRSRSDPSGVAARNRAD